METSPLPLNGWKLLTYSRHSWPLNSEDSLACCTATPTVTRDIRLLWSSPRTRYTLTYCRAFGSGDVTTCFYELGLSRLGYEHPSFHWRDWRSTHCATAAVHSYVVTSYSKVSNIRISLAKAKYIEKENVHLNARFSLTSFKNTIYILWSCIVYYPDPNYLVSKRKTKQTPLSRIVITGFN